MGNFFSYNPGIHGGEGGTHQPSHVIVTGLPLTDIEFSHQNDTELGLGRYYDEEHQRRPADECPRFTHLQAVPGPEPFIKDRPIDPVQFLDVPCDERVSVGDGRGTSYPVCKIRLAAAGLSADALPVEQVTKAGEYAKIRCPFSGLGAVACGRSYWFDLPVRLNVGLNAQPAAIFPALHPKANAR
ncbi:MAG: hypothetical protein AAB834_07715 [Patescibacteria group bacterium]